MSKNLDLDSSTVRLNLGGFSSGIYLINVKEKSITKNFKILIK